MIKSERVCAKVVKERNEADTIKNSGLQDEVPRFLLDIECRSVLSLCKIQLPSSSHCGNVPEYRSGMKHIASAIGHLYCATAHDVSEVISFQDGRTWKEFCVLS